MKKIIVAILALVMVLSLATPMVGAVNVADAKDGDLLYTVDFRGDDTFKPEHFGADSSKKFTMTPSEDGTTLNIKGNPDAGETGSGYWGGIFEGITFGREGAYTMVYKVRANGNVGKNNSIGVGAVIIDKLVKQNAMFYCNYGNYNTQDENGDVSMRRSSLSKGGTKIAKADGTEYIMWDTIGKFAVDADGFVTCMVEYDADNKEMSSYVMAEGAGDGTKESDWIKLETQNMQTNMVDDYIGLKLYVCYTVVDSDLKDVQLYKGFRFEHSVETEPEETKPAATKPAESAPVESEPAEETEPAAQGGCGGTVSLAGLALVATLGTCAVVSKKRR